MDGQGCCGSFFQKCKPYIAMISLQFGYAGMNIITKVSLNRGMSHYVLVVYRHAFATGAIAPFALILERKVRPKITFPIFMQIFALGLLGPVIDQNLYYAGLKFTSPTFSCAMSNMLPAMTFVMAVLCRMEKVNIKKVRCQAKVVGTIVTVLGAMLMTLYKGPIMEMVWSKHIHPRKSYVTDTTGTTDKDWLKGSILLIIATLSWAAFFILQAITMKKYTAPLSLTSLVCFMGTLQSIAVTFVMEHRPSVWTIGWDMNLLAAAYAGIVSSSIAYYVQGLVMQKRGPVFVTAFSPLMMIIVAIMGSFILAEKIFLGGVLGAILIVAGLYSVLWGKYKEFKEKEATSELTDAVKGIEVNGHVMDDIEANDVELEKAKAKNLSALSQAVALTVTVSVPEPPMKANGAPKANGY
ncbi:WAT1-related protein At5g07050-like [Magnolia sinica]|uniref:WAT1-related protein At5g07050-like n=1 Tax=Magnolia sinica TaxID=86752 RepID=UPI00265B354C|nr:WAT1-related protein At5g07050-like [Magnolia sinica]